MVTWQAYPWKHQCWSVHTLFSFGSLGARNGDLVKDKIEKKAALFHFYWYLVDFDDPISLRIDRLGSSIKMAKNKNKKISKNNGRRKHQKAVDYKSNYRYGERHSNWKQPIYLQHYEDLPTEYYTQTDLDPRLLEKPSLAHLDFEDIDLPHRTTNPFSVLDQQQQDLSLCLTSTTTTTEPTIYHLSQRNDPDGDFYFDGKPTNISETTTLIDTNPDDCFFFDETPTDITFSQPTIFIDGNASKITKQNETISLTPGIQSASLESERTKKKRKQHRKLVETAKKIIPGDDIHIDISNSDNESLMPSIFLNNNNNRNALPIDHDDDDDKDLEDMTYTFHEEAALDQDFIENTDPDTWQQLQQWATKYSVDEQSFEKSDDFESVDSNNYGDDQWDGSGDPIADFGMEDSEDDEFIQQYTAHQQHQQHLAQGLQRTIMNTLSSVPSSLYKGMHGFLQHNRRYASKNTIATIGHHISKDMNTYSAQLRRLDRRIQLFLGDTSRQRYQLPEMTLYCRQLVQGLVKFYHIKVTTDNTKEQKLRILLKKCPKTQSPKNRRSIERYIDKAQIPGRTKRRAEFESGKIQGVKSSSRKSQGQDRQRSGGARRGGFRSGKAETTHAEHGTVVGLAAAPLASDNVGHQLLAKMGWKEGEALGTNKDGIADPIQAVIRARRRGLGA